jgi:hypothetical protein
MLSPAQLVSYTSISLISITIATVYAHIYHFGPSFVFVVPPRLNIESCRLPLLGRVSYCWLSLSTWVLFATYVYV